VAELKLGTISLGNTGELPQIKTLRFVVEAESLKSGKGAMDKNTYKLWMSKHNI
jgi:hypothetical protein